MQLDDVVSSVADDEARFTLAMERSIRWLDRCVCVCVCVCVCLHMCVLYILLYRLTCIHLKKNTHTHRCIKAHARPKEQNLFGIVQGGYVCVCVCMCMCSPLLLFSYHHHRHHHFLSHTHTYTHTQTRHHPWRAKRKVPRCNDREGLPWVCYWRAGGGREQGGILEGVCVCVCVCVCVRACAFQ